MSASTFDPLLTLRPERWHAIRHFYGAQWVERVGDRASPLAFVLDDPGSWQDYNCMVIGLEDPHLVDQMVEEGRRRFPDLGGDFPRPAEVGLWQLSSSDLISVVVPVFNEQSTIVGVLRDLACVPAVGQIIVVNDASRDETATQLALLEAELEDEFWRLRLPAGMRLLSHATNQGKGAALRTGFAHAELPWIGIQDADTEYDPRDLMRLLSVARRRGANVVYGSRFCLRSTAASPLWHRAGNSAITAVANVCFGLRLTDVETCYKLIERPRLQAIQPSLKECRFGIEIELTAKLARSPGVCFAECPIAYDRRTYAEGKKIGLRDAFRAMWCMSRYRRRD